MFPRSGHTETLTHLLKPELFCTRPRAVCRLSAALKSIDNLFLYKCFSLALTAVTAVMRQRHRFDLKCDA